MKKISIFENHLPGAANYFDFNLRVRTPPTALSPSRLFPTSWTLVRRLPHDPSAFTQGLALHGRTLFEATGGYGTSGLRAVSLAGARYTTLQQQPLPPRVFGEGIALWPPVAPNSALQLQWHGGLATRWSLSPELRAAGPPLSFSTSTGEGWGLAALDAARLVMSDGSATLHVVAPRGGALVEAAPRVQATLPSGAPLHRLNALTGAHGWVLANVWGEARVAVISPTTGRVASLLDFAPLAAENAGRGEDGVMNGLAYTVQLDVAGGAPGAVAGEAWGGRLFLTGKLWGAMYEVALGGLRS